MKDAYGFEHLDVDDYYWLPAKLPFTEKRGVRERQDLLRGDIEANEDTGIFEAVKRKADY